MHAVGIDTHKDSLAACLVDERGAALDERTFSNAPAGHRGLLAWIDGNAAELVIGIEGSASFGAPAARFLVAAGRRVREVPPQLSRRERIRTRRAGKSDPADALAIARVTLRESNLPPVRLVDRSLELQLLVEAREDLVAEQTRVRNRLHADLRTLLPGYGATAANLTAVRHQQTVGRQLRRLQGVQAELARARLTVCPGHDPNRPLELEMDGLGMADRHRHPHARRADRQIGRMEDLARLVDHLLLFAVNAVALVATDLWDHVQMDLVRVHVARQRCAAHVSLFLRLQLVDRAPAST
jgi:hypothetical protein